MASVAFCMSCRKQPIAPALPGELLCFVYDSGSIAVGAKPGGVSFALWTNGAYVMSDAFPNAGNLCSGLAGSSDVAKIQDAVREAQAVCRDQSLVMPSSSTFMLGRRQSQSTTKLLVSQGMILSPSNFDATPCKSAILAAITDIRERFPRTNAGIDGLEAELNHWFASDRKAFE